MGWAPCAYITYNNTTSFPGSLGKTLVLPVSSKYFLFILFALNLQEHSYIFTNSQVKKPSKSLLAVLSRVIIIQCSLHTRARFYNNVYGLFSGHHFYICNVFKTRIRFVLSCKRCYALHVLFVRLLK